MPELPEVETIRRGLEARIVGHRIATAWRSDVPLRKPSPLPLSVLAGHTVTALRRHAKVLFWDLDDGMTLVAHLGMTGKFLFHAPDEPRRPHTHLVLGLDDGTELRFSDPRRFGWLSLHAPDDPPRDADHYGPDALDPAFTPEVLGLLLDGSRAPLKSFLLDQTKVAGLGNIYACEALWRTGLSPRRKACNTPHNKVIPLHTAIQAVLRDSLAQGGTSFNDYVNEIGEPGKFVADLAVFQREDAPCPRCGTGVRRIVQSGRSTFYCPTCQR